MSQKNKLYTFIIFGVLAHFMIALALLLICNYYGTSYLYAMLFGIITYGIFGLFSNIYYHNTKLGSLFDTPRVIYTYLLYGKWVVYKGSKYLIAYRPGILVAVYFNNSFTYYSDGKSMTFDGNPNNIDMIKSLIEQLIKQHDAHFSLHNWDGYLDQDSLRLENIGKILK